MEPNILFSPWELLAGQALLRRTQVGPLQLYSSLDFDSWDASVVLTLVFIYGEKWRQSLGESLGHVGVCVGGGGGGGTRL